MNVNVSVKNSCPVCKPEPPAPPKKPLAGYDDASTEFVVARPDMGVVLRTEKKALKAHCGDLIKDLVYADKNMKLQTITGVLSNVLCRVEMKPTAKMPPMMDAPNIIRGTHANSCCCPPDHPMGGRIIPAVIVVDTSAQYGSSVVQVPIEAIRDFTADEVDPDCVYAWDFDFMQDNEVVFYAKFEPKMVLWNGKEVTVFETRGNIAGAKRYGFYVDDINQDNSIVIIGEGNAVVSNMVRGYEPVVEQINSVALAEQVKALADELEKDPTYRGEKTMIHLLSGCYGLGEVMVGIGKDPAMLPMPTVTVKTAVDGEIVWPLDNGMDTATIDEDHNLSFNVALLQYLAYMNTTVGAKLTINGFDIPLPELPDVAKDTLKFTNYMLVNDTDENDRACPCTKDEIHLTRYDQTCGISYLLTDSKGEKIPAETATIIGVRTPVTFSNGKSTSFISYLAVTKTATDEMKSDDIVLDKYDSEVKMEYTTERMIDAIIPGKGMGTFKFVTHTKKAN